MTVLRTDPVPSGAEGVAEEAIRFPRGGGAAGDLVGTVALPATPAPAYPLGLITLHGWAGTRVGPHRLLLQLGRHAAAAGIPALRFDLPGRGESDGAAETVSLDAMIDDALAARDVLRTAYGVEAVAYAGLCSGGNVAIGAATLAPAAGLILLGTLPFAPRSAGMARRKTAARLREYARKALRPSTWLRLLRGEVDVGGVGRTLAAAGRESDAARHLKDSPRDIPAAFARSACPSLFLYGGADPEAAEAERVYRDLCARNGIPASFFRVADANHNFSARAWTAEVEKRAAAFLETLSPAEA